MATQDILDPYVPDIPWDEYIFDVFADEEKIMPPREISFCNFNDLVPSPETNQARCSPCSSSQTARLGKRRRPTPIGTEQSASKKSHNRRTPIPTCRRKRARRFCPPSSEDGEDEENAAGEKIDEDYVKDSNTESDEDDIDPLQGPWPPKVFVTINSFTPRQSSSCPEKAPSLLPSKEADTDLDQILTHKIEDTQQADNSDGTLAHGEDEQFVPVLIPRRYISFLIRQATKPEYTEASYLLAQKA